MRCAAHGLAIGPDGECVLCRRDRRSGPRSRRAVWGWVGGAVALVGGVAAAASIAAGGEVASAPTASEQSPSEAPSEVVAPELAAPPYEPRPPPVPTVAEAPPTAEASADVPAARDAGAEGARPTQADLERALRATPVMMYTTRGCPFCRKARQYFAQQGIAYRERDIDANEEAREELERRTGRTSVPTIELDGVLLPPGFNEAAIGRALVTSLERRLGVRGLELRRVD
jgi:glutaredoxin